MIPKKPAQKEASTKVNITGTDNPLPVNVLENVKDKPKVIKKKDGTYTLEPDTTEEEDITKIGQRRVNLIWEVTQATISIFITAAVIFCSIKGIEAQDLKNSFFLIVSMYFVRTNHQLIGGTGAKPLNQQR